MKQTIHRAAAIMATLCVAAFFSSTLLVEVFGSIEAVRQVKSLILFPGLFILVPTIALTGATGFSLAKQRAGRVINRKKKRMPFVAMNGALILIPAAIFLNQWAIEGNLDTRFYLLQAAELVAGAANLVLMTMNIIDGKKFRKNKR